MAENRINPRNSQQPREDLVLESESLRSAATEKEPSPAKDEERISIFWRVFGGTLLSIAALVIITLCQYFNNSLNEVRRDLGQLGTDLRKDLGHLTETKGDLVTKDEFASRLKSVWDNLREIQADHNILTALKERANLLEQRLKNSEDDRKELAREVQHLREQKAIEDDRKELVRELQRLRERLSAMEGRQGVSAAIKPAVHRDE
jgi:DNA repair exonuclease SbcCD ATPase subunit